MRNTKALLRACIISVSIVCVHHLCALAWIIHDPRFPEVVNVMETRLLDFRNDSSSLTYHPIRGFQENMSHGVIARASSFWPINRTLPCFPQDADMKRHDGLRIPADRGFFFIKLMKTGSSTAAGINIRISKHTAMRQHKNHEYCQARWDHGMAWKLIGSGQRNRETSFLWTILREPTARAVSQFFHFEVSRENSTTDDATFQQYLRKSFFYHHYLRTLSTEQVSVWEEDAPAIINKILSDYDFIGITERMEESAVALMMLLNLPMADVMFLDAKSSGDYDDGAHRGKCFYIQPSFVSDGMQRYFQGPAWKMTVKWDRLLYEAANRSLDLTIEKLGKSLFQTNLERFRHMQMVARERCIPRQVFPCTRTGEKNPNANCLWADSACGNDCLNEVATEMSLW